MQTRELLVLRHGKSDWSTNVTDFNRPLKNRGKRGAQHMGLWMQQNQLLPDYIICSPAQRTIATTEIVCATMNIASTHIHTELRLYLASLKDLLQILGNCPSGRKRTLLVGHNPELEELVTYLADAEIPPQKDDKLLATATIARFAMPQDWKNLHPGCATLVTIQRAADLSG
jgi:phosphohistidine phosphatase